MSVDEMAVPGLVVADDGFTLRSLVNHVLPLPGCGETQRRFAALRAAGERDLTVGRLWEAHADAIAILSELGAPSPEPDSTWGVWAAEPPGVVLEASPDHDRWRLSGKKAWCSGAGLLSHALVTSSGRLFAVDLSQPGVRPVGEAWPSSALLGTDTRPVAFEDAIATAVGEPGDYLNRPGFWYGATGVAAVWLGGAISIARPLLNAALKREPDDITAMHLGAVDVAIATAKAIIDAAAEQADRDPADIDGLARIFARRSRAAAEQAVETVIGRVGHALGPGPLAMNREHAQRIADLSLYVRQSHAERDLADLGRQLVEQGDDW